MENPPFHVGNTSSFMVYFPASYVSLAGGNYYRFLLEFSACSPTSLASSQPRHFRRRGFPLRCRIRSKIFQCPKIALTTRTTGRLFVLGSLDEMSWDFGKTMGLDLLDDLLDVRQNSASIPRPDESRRWMVTPFSYFFPFDVKTFGFVPLTVYPESANVARKCKKQEFFAHLLTKFIDDLLNFPLLMFPQQQPSFFVFEAVLFAAVPAASHAISRDGRRL